MQKGRQRADKHGGRDGGSGSVVERRGEERKGEGRKEVNERN